MSTPRLTDERLRSWLNGNQPDRERLCISILMLDPKYTEIHPRRPEGGPDGGRDIECVLRGEKCFGAVGFRNNACDSPEDIREIRRKFKADVNAARAASQEVKSFVFLCNVDLTSREVEQLEAIAHEWGFTNVDIYWRERIRLALDGTDGLPFRHQYLSIPLSEAEQAAFFSRYGKELEKMLTGRFDRIEERLEAADFARWKSGCIRSIRLHLNFKEMFHSLVNEPEHFRFALELQGVVHEHRSIFIGGREDYQSRGEGRYCFGTKAFFWLESRGDLSRAWLPEPVKAWGGEITGIEVHIRWKPISNILVAEFEELTPHLHVSENLVDRIGQVELLIDDYLFLDWSPSAKDFNEKCKPNAWPGVLTDSELKLGWRFSRLPNLDFETPRKRLRP